MLPKVSSLLAQPSERLLVFLRLFLRRFRTGLRYSIPCFIDRFGIEHFFSNCHPIDRPKEARPEASVTGRSNLIYLDYKRGVVTVHLGLFYAFKVARDFPLFPISPIFSAPIVHAARLAGQIERVLVH